jgi:hypothetical protein
LSHKDYKTYLAILEREKEDEIEHKKRKELNNLKNGDFLDAVMNDGPTKQHDIEEAKEK